MIKDHPLISVVDDDESIRESLPDLIREFGFSVRAFSSAEEFLESANRRHAACLILDVRLPGMSGIALQRALAEANDALPIIFVTAHGDAALREALLKAGAFGFLNKPVRSDALLKEIHAALQKTRNREGTNESSKQHTQ